LVITTVGALPRLPLSTPLIRFLGLLAFCLSILGPWYLAGNLHLRDLNIERLS